MISLVYELEIHVPVRRMKLANSHGFICGGSVCIYIDLRAEFDHVKSNATDMWAFFFFVIHVKNKYIYYIRIYVVYIA